MQGLHLPRHGQQRREFRHGQAEVRAPRRQASDQRLQRRPVDAERITGWTDPNYVSNDMLRGLPPEQTRANLDAILGKLKARKVPVLLTRAGTREVAMHVDGLGGTREIVIKALSQWIATGLPLALIAPVAARPATPTAVVPTARKHVVRAGDTLSKLAQQYYNNRAKWRDIYAANRNVMKSESDMKVGMELKIP